MTKRQIEVDYDAGYYTTNTTSETFQYRWVGICTITSPSGDFYKDVPWDTIGIPTVGEYVVSGSIDFIYHAGDTITYTSGDYFERTHEAYDALYNEDTVMIGIYDCKARPDGWNTEFVSTSSSRIITTKSNKRSIVIVLKGDVLHEETSATLVPSDVYEGEPDEVITITPISEEIHYLILKRV